MTPLDEAPTAIRLSDRAASEERATTTQVDPRASTLGDEGHVARYQVRDLLGEGGMGEVRLCRDRRIGREVAMKVIRSEHADQPEVRARFLREARVQGQLEHPAIVPVYDIGFGDDGATHFTMKRVEGKTLSEVITALADGDEETLAKHSRRKLLTAFASVCQAVDFAHRRGVVHRDLKPDNIMLGAYGEVYVLDWGVARLVGADAETASPVALHTATEAQTQHGAVIGTIGYMAPEQLRGEVDAIGPCADVYALGAVLYELLTLTPLHARGSFASVMTSTLRGVETPASERAPAQEIAPELDAICARATKLDAGERYETVGALHEAIEGYLDGDRDLALRRTLADAHAAHAEALTETALQGGADAITARKNAMREVGRAVGLVPDHPVALQTMYRLLVTPPTETPVEATEDFEANAKSQTQSAAWAGGFAYLTWLGLLPLLAWMGIRERWSLGLAIALIGAASTVSFLTARASRSSSALQTAMLVAGTAAAMSTYRLFGLWVLLPCVVTANAILFSLSPHGARVRLSTVVGCVAIAALALLEAVGVLAPSATFDGGAMHIPARMTAFPETATRVFLVVIHLGVIVTTTTLMDRFRRSLTQAEQRLRLQTWQLRSLVPEELQRASGARPSARVPGCELP